MILLKTKLNIPPVRSKDVSRLRLIQRLQAGTNGILNLVSAPTGFGKTSLVCQWISHFSLPVAWYSLDEDDNDPSVFFRYLLTTLQRLDDSLEAVLEPLVQGRKMPSGRDIMTQVVNYLSALPAKVYLVLDDYHLIQSESIHDALLFLLKNMPPQLHLTLVSRHEIPFPLTLFRARRQMTEIGTTDLGFTEKETNDFFSGVMEIDLSPKQISELLRQTEGWAAGLQMAGLTLKDSLDPGQTITRFHATNQYMLDYALEEVIAKLPENLHSFLLKTSVLKRLHPDLCREITGDDNAAATLDRLIRDNLFLIPLDHEHRWFRYHHLFSELLQRRLAQSENQSPDRIHKQASLWYAGRGYLEEAFYHAFQTNDLEFAADQLENQMFTMLASYEWTDALRWVEKLPEAHLQQRFLLILFRALITLFQESIEKMDAILTDLEERFDTSIRAYPARKKAMAKDLYLSIRIYALFYQGRYDDIIRIVGKEMTSVSPDNLILQGGIQNILAMAYFEKGDILDAVAPIKSSAWAFLKGGGPNLAYEVMTLEAKVVRLQGRLCQSEKMLKDALELSRRDRFTLQAGIVDTSIRLAQIHYYRYELDAAMDSASKCIAYAKSVSDNLALRQGYGIQALIYEIKGDAKLASHLMEKAMSLAGRTHSAIRIAAAEVVAIELALMQRNLRIAVDWAHRRKLNPNEPFSHAFERDCLLLGRIHLAQDKFQQATDLMRSLRPRSEKRGRFESVMKANIIQSAAAYHLGGKDEALPLMEKAVVFAIPEGYIQPFAENAFCIEEMLGSLRNSRHGAQRAFVRKLIEACRMGSGTCDASKSVPVNDFESLTPREALVLKLIANGLTNPEIADYTDVSMSTVKFHINNIYGKLGVKSRMQAIRRAEELNIC